jgi:hypothetical protein
MKLFLLIILSVRIFSAHTQESLLLGELKSDEIQIDIRTDHVKKALIFGYKYKKKNNYKDSTIKGIEDYSMKGELTNRTTFGGKKNQTSYSKKYGYDSQSNVISYDYIISGNGETIGQTADFFYSSKRLTRQVISLANINYNYHPDGRLKSKAYYYNNRGEIDSDPWTIWFVYDDNKNLIHADADTTKGIQTSFYNEKNELIKHDYYPGVAFSTFSYDENGNCSKQVDYELGKKDWDSTIFIFQYDDKNRLVRSSRQVKKGKVRVDKDWKYNAQDQLEYELFYRKGKPKYIYKYYYEKH